MFRVATICMLVLASFSAHASCDWQQTLLEQDRGAINATVAAALALIAPDYGDADENAGAALAGELLDRAHDPQPIGDIAGNWKIRSIQVSSAASGMAFAYAYPNFAATIRANDCGFRFAKTSGSQRHGGQLYPMQGDDRQLVFLGTEVVNDQTLLDYGPDNLPASANGDGEHARNSIGHLWRIGPRTLLLLVDVDANGFNLYQLTR